MARRAACGRRRPRRGRDRRRGHVRRGLPGKQCSSVPVVQWAVVGSSWCERACTACACSPRRSSSTWTPRRCCARRRTCTWRAGASARRGSARPSRASTAARATSPCAPSRWWACCCSSSCGRSSRRRSSTCTWTRSRPASAATRATRAAWRCACAWARPSCASSTRTSPPARSTARSATTTTPRSCAASRRASTARARAPSPPPCAHDLLVWLGDLNYRLEGVSNDEVRATIARGQWARLVAHDQLRKQRAAAGAFVGFEEAPLTFAPTYKYDAGTNTCASPPARTHASSAPSARGGSLQSHAALQPAHPWRLQPCAPGAAPLAGTTRPRSSACPRGRTAYYGAASRPPA